MAVRGRKDVHESYLENGGSDSVDPEQIGNVNTLSDFESKKTGRFNSGAPNSPENLRYSNNQKFLRDYFKDKSSHSFKYGLETATYQDNFEDPVFFGFDFIINNITSPLFRVDRNSKSELDHFFDWNSRKNGPNIKEIENRRGVYQDFIDQLELLFISTRGGAFDTFKSHYLIGVDGLGYLINKSTGVGSEKQFAKFGEDKIKLTIREDNTLSGGYLTMLYNTLSHSKINGKQMIPNNLLRFDCSIVISEIRNYKKIKSAMGASDGKKLVSLVNDSVSRYMYNIFDCQFVIDQHTHPSNVTNNSIESTESFDLGFYYKFSTLEMEKFKFNPNGMNESKYLNDGNRVNPSEKFIGERSDDVNATRKNDFFNSPYQEGTAPYAIYDLTPTSNNIVADPSTVAPDVNDPSTYVNAPLDVMKQNSIRGNIPGLRGQNKEKLFGGLKGILKNTKDFAINKLRRKRDELINNTVNNIRRATGLRRMASPINVYHDNDSLVGFVGNQLRDFAQGGLTNLFGGINDLLGGGN